MHGIPDVPTLPPVALRLPAPLEGLRRLAYNLYWTWNPDVRILFNRIDAAGWDRYRNPIPVLQNQRDWTALLDNPAFMAEYTTLLARFDAYIANGQGRRQEDGPADTGAAQALPRPVAYFCAEFGLHESLGTYSGGLGVLAGDHCKSASDMGLPFVAVGLFYRHGYFRQAIDADGHQEHAYPDYDPLSLPLRQVADENGDSLRIKVDLPGRTVWCAAWLAQVGRIPLLLLDTDLPDNDDSDRPITHTLYVRGREMRLHQEIVLGVGGVRALRALRIEPAAWHLNEGHSAFLLVERARELTASGTPLDEALDRVRSDAVFTIHTPVPAGNERFEADLVRRLAQPLAEGTGLNLERILELGRGADGDPGQFDMTAFSLRLTQGSNAVSRLHAETANATWCGTTSQPIRAITNGIHPPTWLGAPIRALYEDLGADFLRQHDPASVPPFWERIHEIPDRRLWDAHQRQKLELLLFCRGILRDQFARHGESPAALEAVSAALDPEILTIGFARRFATYKRASLLFYDFQRLANLVDRSERPIQLIFAGKAHPADRPGQGVIQEIFGHTRADRLKGRVFILEDYNMRVGRYLVQGVDVWLNNPRRPLEASGTSGMKAAVNGVVNLSVLDGWWDEGWNERNGWAIGGRETNPDEGAQDWADAQALYSLLENEVIPRYYGRGEDGLPHDWLALMKESIASTIWQFSTARMLGQYRTELYEPAAAGAADAAATAGTPPSANLLTPVGSG